MRRPHVLVEQVHHLNQCITLPTGFLTYIMKIRSIVAVRLIFCYLSKHFNYFRKLGGGVGRGVKKFLGVTESKSRNENSASSAYYLWALALILILGSKLTEKICLFYYFKWFSISSGVGGSKEEFWKKNYTPKKLKNREIFLFKIPKTPQDLASPFSDFSHLCYQL